MPGRRTQTFILGFSLLALAGRPALADGTRPQVTYPGAPKQEPSGGPDPAKPRFATTYAEEAAQTLGVHDGRLDLFSTHPSDPGGLVPRISGGVGKGGAMIRLQWKAEP